MKKYFMCLILCLGLSLVATTISFAQTATPVPTAIPTPTPQGYESLADIANTVFDPTTNSIRTE